MLASGEKGVQVGHREGREMYTVEEDEEDVGPYAVTHDEREEVCTVERSCMRKARHGRISEDYSSTCVSTSSHYGGDQRLAKTYPFQ